MTEELKNILDKNLEEVKKETEIIDFSLLSEVLRYRAKVTPDNILYTFLTDDNNESTFTYNQLDQKAKLIASKLLTTLKKGDRALLLYQPGLDFIAGFFGCLYAGVIAVPAYPPDLKRVNKSLPRLMSIIKDCQSSVILTTSDILIFAKTLDDSVPLLKKTSWLTTDNISENDYQGTYNSEIIKDDIAFIQYTSGSTGEAKGVMISHENLIYNQRMIEFSMDSTSKSTFTSWLPQYHDMGLIGNILHPLFIGSSCVFMSPFSFLKKPLKWLQVITKYKIKITGAPNFAYDLCTHKITEEEKKQIDLSSLIHAYNGAEPVKSESLENFYQAFKSCGLNKGAISPVYGMAEATLLVSGTKKEEFKYLKLDKNQLEDNKIIIDPEQGIEIKKLVSCGKTILEQKIMIVDPQTLNSCSDNTVGEIWLSGKNIAKGYWNNKEKTKEIFQAYINGTGEGPFLRTGDLGFINDNELYVTGRIKDLIIIRGRNIYPFDIEYTIDSNKKHFPEIRLGCNAAFSIEKDNEEHLVIIQELDTEKNKGFDAQLLEQALRKSILDNHEISTYEIVFVNAGNIPKTSSGKIMRYACKKAFENNFDDKSFQIISYNKLHSDLSYDQLHTNKDDKSEPKSNNDKIKNLSEYEIEEWIINWLHHELKLYIEKISKNISFADFGLNSLTSIRLIGDLEDFTGISLSKTVLWDHQNIAKLTSYLIGDKNDKEEETIKIENKNYLSEPIAIIGTGCRLPGNINSIDDLWQAIEGNKDLVSEIPTDRYNITEHFSENINELGKIYTKAGGFLTEIDKFNPNFFDISPREAISLDPQQRLLLEVTWEALENSGKNIENLSGSNTSVFVGISSNDYSTLSINSGQTDLIDSYSGTGIAYSIASGRISYLLGLEGASMSIDTACSSSLVAIHQACQSLRTNDSDIAIAGGVNIILAPEPSIYLCNIKALSPDGKCNTFDESANGYVRSEGCGMIVLKRLSDAIKDNDHIHAVIRGSAINQDGKSNGLTAPNGLAQQKVIKKALTNAGLKPNDIDFIEAHGTGTPIGDPIEANSINAVFGQNRPVENPLSISSVKANLGHLEAASGVTGLLKTILCIKNKTIAGNINLNKLNPSIILEKSILVPCENKKWENSNNKYIAGVSSFGLSGTNAHIIIESPPIKDAKVREMERTKHIFCLSAKTEKELRQLASKFSNYLTTNNDSLENICYTSNISRTLFDHRLSILVESKKDLIKGLNDFTKDNFSRELYYTNEYFSNQSAFIFTGQGSQYAGMAEHLYNTNPFFHKILDECCHLFDTNLKKSLLLVIFDQESDLINETEYTQPALFAIEYCLAKLLIYWGIKPDIVMGHSIGEFAAACIAEIFSLEDAVKLVSARGKLMQSLSKNGSMFSIFSDEKTVNDIIVQFKESISIAAVNANNNIVISGDTQQINYALEIFKEKNITFKELIVSHAFHSQLMQPIVNDFYKIAKSVKYSKPKIKFISNLTGKLVGDDFIIDAKYWSEHIIKPVLFYQSVETLCLNKNIHIIEIGSSPVLNTMIKKFKGSEVDLSYTLRKNDDDWKSLCKNLAHLFTTGININWQNFDDGYFRDIIPLPTYVWDKKSYWLKKPNRVKVDQLVKPSKKLNNQELAKSNIYLSNHEIEIWLKDWLVTEAGINPDKINLNTSFELYGLDSVIIVMLLSDIEKWIGKKISISVPYDHSTIKDLANFLSGDY